MKALGTDTQLVILAAGVMFLWALALGTLKYRQMVASPDGLAHPYTDVAHRAALMYSFALGLIAAFVELSAWNELVDLLAAGALAFFFFAAVASYMVHGLRADTTNQFHRPSAGIRAFMGLHIVGSLGGFAVLFAGVCAGVTL